MNMWTMASCRYIPSLGTEYFDDKEALKLARNIKKRGQKRDDLFIVWTYNTIHSTKYVTPSRRCLVAAVYARHHPSMKCARFTCRHCVGPSSNQQVIVDWNCYWPIHPQMEMSPQGSNKNAFPLLLVISILALFIAVRPLLLGGRACLRCSVASILLPLSLLVAGVLRGGSLGRPIALLLPRVALLVGVLLLVPCLLLSRALLVARLLLAVLGVSCRAMET